MLAEIFLPEAISAQPPPRISRPRIAGSRECVHADPACGFVFEIIGKIYRGRSNCGVITEIGLLHIIHGFFFTAIGGGGAPLARARARARD